MEAVVTREGAHAIRSGPFGGQERCVSKTLKTIGRQIELSLRAHMGRDPQGFWELSRRVDMGRDTEEFWQFKFDAHLYMSIYMTGLI